MSDGTLQPIAPYIPPCTDLTQQDFQQDFNSRGLAFNLSDAGHYVKEQVVPSLVPGIVLGTLALIGFLLFLLWLLAGCIAAYCCCCCGRGKKQQAQPAADQAAQQQFIQHTSGQGSAYAYPAHAQAAKGPRFKLLSWRGAFWVFFWALALATIGVAAWGMALSIDMTDTTVSDFWDVVDNAHSRVTGTIESLDSLANGATSLSTASQTLSQNSNSVVSALETVAASQGRQLSESEAQVVANVLAGAPAALDSGSVYIADAAAFLRENVNDTIADLRRRFRPPTMAVQETWRFIPFAVIFGVTILVVLPLMVLAYKVTWPRTTLLLVALLWLCICLLMLLGTGLLNGVYVVSSDGCLFVETWAVHYVWRKTRNSSWGPAVTDMVQYYIGRNDSVFTGGSLIPQGTGNPALEALRVYLPETAQEVIQNIDVLLQGVSSATEYLAATANDPQLQQTLQGIAGPGVVDALQTTGTAVTQLTAALTNLTALANRTNVLEVYRQSKTYICCDLRNTANEMWVAWTVVGALGFALAVLASGVVVHAARMKRQRLKSQTAATMGGGVLWHRDAANGANNGPSQSKEDELLSAPLPAPPSPFQQPHGFVTDPATHSGIAPVRHYSGAYAGGPTGAMARV